MLGVPGYVNILKTFLFFLQGFYSVANGSSNLEMETQTSSVNSTFMFYNNNTDVEDVDDSPLWMVLMDQSQLVMTLVGFIANMATSITLIKNGQVGGTQVHTKF